MMRSFSEMGLHVEDADVASAGGREKVAALLAGLDSSWASTARTTLGVMLAVSACAKDKEAAGKCLSGLLDMMGKMCDAYCGLLGWQATPVEPSELLAMSNAVDAAGQELVGKVDELGMAMMMNLLVALPKGWTEHFNLLLRAKAGMMRALVAQSVGYLLGMLVEVQREKLAETRRMARESVFSLNSRPAVRAREWSRAAAGVFDAVVAGGFGSGVALAEAIKKVGFPDAMGG